MRLILVAFGFAITSLHVGSVAAQSRDCDGDQSQAQMTQCAADEFAAVEARLKTLSAALAAASSPADRVALQAANTAFAAYRDLQCAFETRRNTGASIEPMLTAMCKAALTSAQADRLAAAMACEEGDVACGGD